MTDIGSVVGSRAVIASGTLVTESSAENVNFKGAGATFGLRFSQNQLLLSTMSLNFVSPQRIEIDLVNFNNPLGTAGKLIVGNYQSKSLHLAVVVYFVGKEPHAQRLIHYTLSLGG